VNLKDDAGKTALDAAKGDGGPATAGAGRQAVISLLTSAVARN
jgi:hypothetical protein